MYALLENFQSKQVIDSVQIFAGLREARRQAFDYKGGMHWKTVAGVDYLYRSLDRHGNARSQGRRSTETEAKFEAFHRRKTEISERVKSLETVLSRHAKINAAFKVGHVPNRVANVCQQLDDSSLMGSGVMIIGTNALHVYEALASVRFEQSILATTDIDLLWDHKSKLSLAASQKLELAGLIGLLKKADKTYEILPNQSFRAMASDGFMVDLIRQMPSPPWKEEPDRFLSGDMIATDIANMQWMLAAPVVRESVIAQDGRVFMMAAPDPRAFAMFKLWLSTAPDREPAKKSRDAAQAEAVIRLVEERLPHLAENWSALKSFPQEVVESALIAVDRMRC